MSMSPRARLTAGSGRGGASGPPPGAMGVVSKQRTNPQPAGPSSSSSLLARLVVFGLALAAGAAVWRSRSVSDDLWREGRRAPPLGFCARQAKTVAAAAAAPATATPAPTTAPPPPPFVCAHSGVDGVRGRNSRAALKQAAEVFDCVELDVSATLTGELVALHPHRGPREELEFGEEEPPRRTPRDAVVGDYTLEQVQAMRWRRVRSAPPELGRLRSLVPQRRVAKKPQEEEGPLPVAKALDVVLAAWSMRDAKSAAAAADKPKRRTLILDVKRPEGKAAKNVTFEGVADAAARAAAEAGCGSWCVLWAADDEASRALAAAVARHGGGGGGGEEGEEAGGRPRIGYVVAFAEEHRKAKGAAAVAAGKPTTAAGTAAPELAPRLEGVAQVAAVDVAVLASGGGRTRRRGKEQDDGGDSGGVAGPFERADPPQTLVAFVVDGGRALRAAAGSGAHALVTDAPVAVSNVLSAWRRRCG